ncbi:GNAT family N-acetyltransferase [Enterococcus casseliflavus]|uniref:GNAT family N-acetyltransferase n=1 Tax=Enterococcus sp. AZ051 TaxID=2774698 RepID=UPI0018846757|nr:GNAT family N-acetyltransferase [Enterococcus casseliflavus]
MDYHVLKKNDSGWLEAAKEIYNADWAAAKYLANRMIGDKFKEWEGIVVAETSDRIVGFCSFVGKDIVDLTYSPYIAIVYVEPDLRGNGISKELVEIAENQLITEGFQGVYIVTQHVGLYEKWGYSQIDEAEDKFGRSMRVLGKKFNTISVVE